MAVRPFSGPCGAVGGLAAPETPDARRTPFKRVCKTGFRARCGDGGGRLGRSPRNLVASLCGPRGMAARPRCLARRMLRANVREGGDGACLSGVVLRRFNWQGSGMGKNSRIEWTHHTFNPWWGCVRVSDACKHCYAEAWAKRVGSVAWGARAERRFFSDAHWRQPLKWQAEAEAAGERRRVFCASMADVFEDRRDLDAPRERLAGLIATTPRLDWLLLTKRPEVAQRLAPWGAAWPENVWLGTTAENARWAAKRLPALVAAGARVRFVSCEPLLGPLDLSPWLDAGALHWVIAGGESGGGARPSDPAWFLGLRDQCAHARVPFHFKQWGNWAPATVPVRVPAQRAHGPLIRMSKSAAGRILDGAVWDGLPSP